MRPILIAAPALLAALGLATAAGASINYNASKSNTGKFTAECKRLGGTPATANGQTSCALPKPTKMAVKGSGVPASLTAACATDHGKIAQKGGASVCVVSAADQRSYTQGK